MYATQVQAAFVGVQRVYIGADVHDYLDTRNTRLAIIFHLDSHFRSSIISSPLGSLYQS
jgi:hypothetical protein